MNAFSRQALRLSAAIAVLLASAVGAAADPGVDALLKQLTGTWSGSGHVDFTNGERWGLHCPKMVWTRSGKSSKIKSTIICSTHPQQGYKINLTAHFNVSAKGSLSGTWSESNYAASGSHKGSFSSKGTKTYRISGTLKGEGIAAQWSSTVSGCALTMSVRPKNAIATSMKSKFRKRSC